MHRKLRLPMFVLCAVLTISATRASAGETPAQNSQVSVTPISGESWIHHLHRPFGDTSMGKTGRLGPPPSEAASFGAWQARTASSSSGNFSLHGSDLYRLNCQGCHGEAGLGAPPEIRSIVDPVRATSAAMVIERMKSRGVDMSGATANELAKESQKALLDRIHNGGQDMPAFPQLTNSEVAALMEELKRLTGMPAAREVSVSSSPMRVGELIAKSTCHVCHDATGPNPTPEEMENGAIPPLQWLTTRADESQFIRKVTSGAPVIMGTPPTPHRGRMPVFYYLTPEEAADVYMYLATYAPSELTATATVMASVRDAGPGGPSSPGPGPSATAPVKAAVNEPAIVRSTGELPDWAITLVLIAAGALVLALVGAGFTFGAYELHRLGRDGELRKPTATHAAVVEHEVGDLVTH